MVKIKPNFFIAGMARSGTTSMYTYLKQHPEIFLSIHKEPHFFSKDLNMPSNYVEDEELYYSLFQGAGEKKAVGEASVWYLCSKTAAKLIKSSIPEAKIIIMLRNPVDMMYSLHSLWVRSGNEDIEDFQQALSLVEKRMNGSCLPGSCYFPYGLFYTEIARYYDKVKRFLDAFGKHRIHFIIFDDFVSNTVRVYRETLDFLGVGRHFTAEFDGEKAAKIIQNIVFKQLRQSRPEIQGIVKYGIRKLNENKQKPPRPPMEQGLRSHLQPYFYDDIEKTGGLIGRDLTHWCIEY